MGLVHYRYRSGVQTFSLPIPGAFASVAELKRLIAATGRHGTGRTRGRGPRDGIALCDPRTGEEYVDENTLIPQNSTVVVHRVAGHPTDAIITSPIVLENDGMASNKPVTESTLKSSGFTEADDEEAASMRTVIDAAEIKWGVSSSGGGYDGGGGQLGHRYGRPLEGEAPPPGYVCRICHIPGHFIWHCPSESKPPPPGYICHKCGVPGHFIHSCPNYGDTKYDSRRTSSLIPIISSSDNGIPAELARAMSSSVSDSLPAELHCPLCKKVMTDAMLTSKCCYDSFCDKCIRDYIIAQSNCICGVEILVDDLIPNHTLRSTISSMLSSRGGGISSGTGNLASSISSNLDGKSISFSASAVLKGDNKQHMDSAPSIAAEGSLLITVCKNPVGHHEKLKHSDLQSKTEETEKASVKKTIAVAGAMETAPELRRQKRLPPDGVVIVSGNLQRKVVKSKSSKKQKKAGTTGKGDTNCDDYDCNIPFEPSCYNSSFGLGGLPWGADPYSMYFMSNMASSGYPMGLYNVNGISNLPLHAPGMQGYPASYYSGFQPTVFQDHEASAHASLSNSHKGAGPQSPKPEGYHSRASTQKGGSRSGGRSVPEMRDSSTESHDYYEEYHNRKKVGTHPASSSPRDSGQRTVDSSSFESHDYREEFHSRKKVGAHPARSPRDGGQHRRALDDGGSFASHDYDEEFHGRRKERARSRSRKSSSRHSYRRRAYEGSTWSNEESNLKQRWGTYWTRC
ncbi:E3 ubiquitin ligase PARAQUAT TOLERANCE 3 isoform X2 [Setaria italica]|uniref:E3 ubiquitin ligase PARAQUAT TOLERANCE 3 isoform X2 n=1 Tax=Setaria italica TaxID=4555 RepID=UPI0003512D6A|nr:E3 ubiquitin ligase PARAQUAT TOLERANCE 3 isoform X2 [Setaria italica]